MVRYEPGAARPMFALRAPLVLASSSPRRRELLRSLGMGFFICPAPEEAEPRPDAGETPDDYACRAALAKATRVRELLRDAWPDAVILGADTVVAVGERVLGKPRDADEAFAFLRLLAGREHRVSSACAALLPDGRRELFSVAAAVRLWDAPEETLWAYARSGDPLDKAGGYALQGQGAFLAASVSGSWSAVVGLPLAELVAVLLRAGVCAELEKGAPCSGETE